MEDRIAANNLFEPPKAAASGILLLLLWLIPTMILWALAFYQVPAGTPEWLARAQSACFGTDSTGLPSAQGWTILILAPLTIISAAIVAFVDELKQGLRLLVTNRLGQLLIVLLAIVLSIQTYWIAGRIKSGFVILNLSYQPIDGLQFPENYPKVNKAAPDFQLIDQYGLLGGIGDQLTGPVILSFVFAHCATVCPTIVGEVNQAAGNLASMKVSAMLITLDPWRDTPSSLPAMAKRFRLGTNVRLYSGEVEEVEKVLTAYDMTRVRDQKNGDIAHPALVYIISRSKRISYSLNNPSSAWIEEAVKRLHD